MIRLYSMYSERAMGRDGIGRDGIGWNLRDGMGCDM